MKKLLIKLISMLLLIALLLPLAVACKKDPPPDDDDDDDDENGDDQYYIDAALTGYESTPLLLLTSEEFTSASGITSDSITAKEGKTMYVWNTSEQTARSFVVPAAYRNIQDRFYVEFSIYTEQETDAEIILSLAGAGSTTIKLDFTGMRNYRLQTDSLAVTNPFPDVSGVSFSVSSGTAGTVYISDVYATDPVYTLSVPEGVSLDDPALYEGIINGYREFIVGYAGGSGTPEYLSRIEAIEDDCEEHWKLFKDTKPANFEVDTLFGITVAGEVAGYGYQERSGTNAWTFYQCVEKMAKGWGAYGSEYYHNADLLADIKYALEYGYAYFYGAHIVETGRTYGNWWEWDIGIPLALIGTLVIIDSEINDATTAKYLAPFDKIMRYPQGAACNLIDMALNVILSSALTRNATRICAAKDILSTVFYYADEPTDTFLGGDGGFYTDGSYLQHGNTPYTGAYGNNLITAISTIMYVMKDGRFALQGELINNQYEWILNNFRPFIYDDNFMAFLNGRAVSRGVTEASNLASIMAGVIKMSTYAPEPYKTELRSLIRYCMINGNTDYTKNVPLSFIDYCIQLRADETVPALTLLDETSVYGRMDRIVQHRPDYAVGISLSSTRIYKYESINTENKCGWYHGDGMIYIYTDDYDYGYEFFWYADPYLMPGATVSNGKRVVTCIYPAIFNTSPYAGGVEQGKYGAAGFILGYPENAPAFEDANAKNISAKKSYFTFDNEIVCIGSDIYDDTGKGARTVVENRLWRENDVLTVNGAAMSSPATAETTISARTMHFTNMGGYVFLDKNPTVLYSKVSNTFNGTREGSASAATGTRDFLEISLSHGTGNVDGGKYSYVYLPEATVQETEDYNANPDVVILKRSENTHAVLEKTLGIVGCTFFDDFSDAVALESEYTAVTYVESETPCAVMISKNADGSYAISGSDPTQTYSTIKLYVSISGVSEVVSADAGVTASVSGGTVNITVNAKDSHGATFNLTVK